MYQATLEIFPHAFLDRLKEILPGDRYLECLETFIRSRETTFRVNTLKAVPDDVLRTLRRERVHPNPVNWSKEAFRIDTREREALLASSPYGQGMIYVQNLSSMVPPLILDPQPGEQILDLTAAPGSKTVQMAAMMGNEGEIIAVERSRTRFFKLLNNLKIQGVANTRAFVANGELFWRHHVEAFDRVLLDAPCSTEGRFHVDDSASFKYWSLRKIEEMVRKQNRLFYSALHCTKVGGTLVYSTCSFAPEENEGVLSRQLRKFGDAIRIEGMELPFRNTQNPLKSWGKKSFDDRIAKARRILPTRSMEAFFICKIRKLDTIGR